MPNSASRLLTLILLLQQRPGRKAADLADELGVSVRTLHRYLSTLDEMGIPIYAERGPLGGFSLVRGYKMPPLIFTPEEAAAVSLGTNLVSELLGSLYQESAQSALLKLDHILPDDQRAEVSWARRALVVSGLHRSHVDALTPTLEILRAAIRSQRRISLSYQASGREEITQRQVDPYALVFRQGWWYVVGYCHLRQSVRTFRLDRIHNLASLDIHFDLPAHFNIQTYLAAEPQSKAGIEARLQFLPGAAALAHSLAFTWTEIQPQPDQSVIVTMPVSDLDYAAQMVLSFGAWVRVLEPALLQERIVSYARDILAQYAHLPEPKQGPGVC